MKYTLKFLLLIPLLTILSLPSVAEEDLTPEERKEKLEVCYSVCGEDSICIGNCQQAYGSSNESEAAAGDEECD